MYSLGQSSHKATQTQTRESWTSLLHDRNVESYGAVFENCSVLGGTWQLADRKASVAWTQWARHHVGRSKRQEVGKDQLFEDFFVPAKNSDCALSTAGF